MKKFSELSNKKFGLQFLGFIIFIVILTRIDIANVYVTIYDFNISYFLLATLLFIPLLIIKSIRWKLLMRIFDINYSVVDSTIIYAAGIFVGYITPGNLGDFVKTLYLREDGYSLRNSFISVLLDRLFDVISIMMLGFMGFVFLMLSARIIEFSSVLAISVLMIGGVGLFLYNANSFKPIISAWLQKAMPFKYKKNALKALNELYSASNAMTIWVFSRATILTVCGWIVYFFEMYLLAQAIHLEIPFLYLVVCISISIIITLIPISISGIGTRDAALIMLFSNLGYSSESAIALSMTLLAFYAVTLLLCLVAWLIKPVDLSQIRKPA